MDSSSDFHLAIFGDFTGRGAQGSFETGVALAARRGHALDIDTLDDVIARFATRLDLSLSEDGPVVSLEVAELDDLHPDTLFEKLDVFSEFAALRRSLASGVVDEGAIQKLRTGAGAFDVLVPARQERASLPLDVPLSEFESLVGGAVAERAASPVDELLARVVGPHIEAAPDPDAAVYLKAVNTALSELMTLVLHHPRFQALESGWRSLDVLARRIEDCRVTVFDVAAEEIALDLANDEMGESGFAGLLGSKGFSAAIGLYAFDVVPTHADVLARIAGVALDCGTPFITGLEPDGVAAPLHDADDRIAAAWGQLMGRDTARSLGLVTPPVLMRRPYGKKSDPIDAFAYEEFNDNEGLKGMLWGCPALIAGLLAAWNQGDGPILDVDDMPYHVITDRHGDQMTLPATVRVMTESRIAAAMSWNAMPVMASRGGDLVRLGGFRSVSGEPLAIGQSGTVARRTGLSGQGAGLSLSFTSADLSDIRKPPEVGSDPDDIDPDLAALLKDLR